MQPIQPMEHLPSRPRLCDNLLCMKETQSAWLKTESRLTPRLAKPMDCVSRLVGGAFGPAGTSDSGSKLLLLTRIICNSSGPTPGRELGRDGTGSNPVRGGLFIAAAPPTPPSCFLFFSGAGLDRLLNSPPAAPLKNKKQEVWSRRSSIDRPPLRGFLALGAENPCKEQGKLHALQTLAQHCPLTAPSLAKARGRTTSRTETPKSHESEIKNTRKNGPASAKARKSAEKCAKK